MEDYGKMQVTESNKLKPAQTDSNVVIINITMEYNIIVIKSKLTKEFMRI